VQRGAKPIATRRASPAALTLRLLLVGGDLHLHDAIGVGDGTVARLVALLDRIDELHALRHLAEERVLAVEEGRRLEADEELAVAGIGVVGARETDRAAQEMSLRELGLHGLAGAAGAVTERIARLRHEAGDDAMKFEPVIEALFGELLDVRHRLRREIRPELDDDAPRGHIEVESVLEIGRGAHGSSCGYDEKQGQEPEKMHRVLHYMLRQTKEGATLTDRRGSEKQPLGESRNDRAGASPGAPTGSGHFPTNTRLNPVKGPVLHIPLRAASHSSPRCI